MTCFAGDGRAWKVDGSVQALVSLGLATPMLMVLRGLNVNHTLLLEAVVIIAVC